MDLWRYKTEEWKHFIKKRREGGIIFFFSKKHILASWDCTLKPSHCLYDFSVVTFLVKSKRTWAPKPFPPGSHETTSCLQPEGQCSLNKIVLVSNQNTALYQKLLWEAIAACAALAVWLAALCPSNIPSFIFLSVLKNVVGPCLYSSDSPFQLQPIPASAVSHCWKQGGIHW